jgi:hypothetical protein
MVLIDWSIGHSRFENRCLTTLNITEKKLNAHGVIRLCIAKTVRRQKNEIQRKNKENYYSRPKFGTKKKTVF